MQAVLVCPDAHLQHLSPSVEYSKQHMASQIVISTDGQCKTALLFLDLIYDSLETSWLSFWVSISFLFSEPMCLLFNLLSPNGEGQTLCSVSILILNITSVLGISFLLFSSLRNLVVWFPIAVPPSLASSVLVPSISPAKLDNSLLSCCFSLATVGSRLLLLRDYCWDFLRSVPSSSGPCLAQ
jgi:hypothetical protein